MAAWEACVVWPSCVECRSTGVAVDPRTKWPVECLVCKNGREAAIKAAKAAVARKRRAEREADQ